MPSSSELLVQFHELGIGLDRKMGFVGPDVEEEGFLGIAFLLQPADAFLHHQRCGIALQLSHFLPVAYEVARVAMVGRGVVLGGHPVVEAVGVGLRLVLAVELAVEVPFSDMAGLVALFLQEFGRSDLAGSEVDLVSSRYPAPDAVAVGRPACEDRRAGGGTYPAGGIALGETHALLGELVEMRGLNHRVPVTGEVSPAQVIGQEDHKVGWLFLGMPQADEGKDKEKGQQLSGHLHLRALSFLSTMADCLPSRTCQQGPLPTSSNSLNSQTIFLSRVISKICGLSGPAWQLPTMKFPFSRSCRQEVDLRSRNLALDFPDHRSGVTSTTLLPYQGISVLQTHGPVDTGLDEIIPDHFSILHVILRDHARLL